MCYCSLIYYLFEKKHMKRKYKSIDFSNQINENNQNGFVRLCIFSRCFDTFMRDFITPLDLCILRMTCRYFSANIKINTKSKNKKEIWKNAMSYGYFNLGVWLIEKYGISIKTLGSEVACVPYSDNDKKVQRQFISKYVDTFNKTITPDAIKRGNLELFIATRYEYKGNPKNMSVEKAAFYGHLDMLKWIHSALYIDIKKCYENAAFSGHLHILKWLKTIESIIPPSTMYYAVKNDNMEILEWLKDNGCLFNEATMRSAVIAENWDAVKWLYENVCPWDDSIFCHERHNPTTETTKKLLSIGLHRQNPNTSNLYYCWNSYCNNIYAKALIL